MDLIDIGIYLTYIFVAVALVAAVVLPLVHAIKHPAALVKSLVGVGAIVVLFIIAYTVSGTERSSIATAMGVEEGALKLIGAGLTLFYFLLLISIVGIIASEISKAFK